MKQTIRFMSMLLAASATALSAGAADWKVNINPVALSPGDTVCIQNVGTGRYLTGGEAWGTQAVLGSISSAARCIIVDMGDGTYQINNNAAGWNETNPNMMYRQPLEGTVGAGVKACFVDYSTAWSLAASKWSIASVGTNTYTFQVPNLEEYQITETSSSTDSLLGYVAGEFLGVNRTHKSNKAVDGVTWGLYYDVSYADSAANCQFQFFPANIVQAKGRLYKNMLEIEAAGVDVSASAALLANPNATAEEVNAEIERLADVLEQAASPTHPMNITSKYISNPTPVAKGTPTGWTVTQPDGSAGQTGDTSDGVGEFWQKKGFSLNYTVRDLPAGVYKFTTIALTRTDMHGKFYVGSDTIDIATVGSDKVNSRAQAAAWFNQDDDGDGVTNGTNVITVVLPETTDIAIGLSSEPSTGDGWTVWREFKIESLGQGVETFHYVNQSLLDQLNAIKDDEGNRYTASLMTECETVLNTGVSTASKQEASECYVKGADLLEKLKANVAAWEKLADVSSSADEAAWQLNNGEPVHELCAQADEMLDALTASTEEVLAMIENIQTTLDKCQKGSYEVGDDVTFLIKNPTFNDEKAENNYQQPQSKENWIGAEVIGAGWITDTRLAEVYNQDCNIHQDLNGLQKGAYRLSIQAFYRSGWASADGYQAYQNGDSLTRAYIYMGKTQQSVKSIYACTFPESVTSMSRENNWVNVGTDSDPLYIPNTMDEAYVAFNGSVDAAQDPSYDNNYRNVVYGVVTEDGGAMPIGFKIENHNEGSWVIFRDFRLEYLGNDPTYINPVLVNKMNEANSEFLSQRMVASDKAALNKAVADAQTAIDNADGDAMMAAFTAIADAEDASKASIAAYKQLAASYDSLKTQLDDATQASAESRTQATNLLNEVSDMLENGTIEVADIPAKQKEMLLARKALMIQPGSDANPSKYTNWIMNPTYEKQDGWTVNKISGDGVPGVQYNTMEIWSATADVHQDIEGLPEGVYEVRVQSLFRPVSADEAWNDLLGDSIENYGERATIYANWDSITPSYWCSKYDPDTYSWTMGGYSDMVDSVLNETTGELEPVTYHFANNREAAEYQFQMNYYPVQTFYTYVGSNGLLRLGFKNTANRPNDWLVVSNWELYYHGKDSQYAGTTGVRDLENNDNVNFNEVYTVDGRRVNGLQKGLNIVRGKTAEGKVVTKKIVVK